MKNKFLYTALLAVALFTLVGCQKKQVDDNTVADTQKLAVTETASIGKKSTLTQYASAEHTKQVWHLFIPDGRHSWPDEQITGINTNQLILEYLELYRP